MQRYPVLYGNSRKLKLRKKRIALFCLVLLLLLAIGVGVNTVSYFSRMTDRDRWAASLKKGAEEGGAANYLLALINRGESGRQLQSLYFISSGREVPFSLLLPGNSSGEGDASFRDVLAAQGTQGVVKALVSLTGEPVHYYVVMEDGLFDVLRDVQGLRNRGPQAYAPDPEAGINQVVGEVQEWEDRSLTFARELVEETPFWRWPFLIKETLGLFETNLSWREINALMKEALVYTLPEERQIHLPPGAWTGTGDGETPLYVVDTGKLSAFLEYMQTGRTEIPRGDIKVEVLNGSGVAGLARRTARFLEDQGFQIVRVADADRFDYAHTQVISRLVDVTPAKEVAILIKGAQLIREIKPGEAMVTVILGKDFDLNRISQ